jgi:peptidyl-prolyl cis-trans isomerase C
VSDPALSSRPRLRTALAVLAVAGLVASCAPGVNGSPTTAATVNGEEIPVSAVERRFQTVKQNPQLAPQLEGDTDGRFRRTVEAQILSQLIRSSLLEQGAAELGITLDAGDVADQRAQIIEQVGGEDAFERIIEQANLTEEDVDSELRELALQERVEERLTADVEVNDEEVREAYERQRSERYERVAARHILVETEEEARELRAQLDQGADFAALAEEHSIDPGSAAAGGDLGEFSRGRLVPEFEDAAFDAEQGEIVGPVESQFGFHVIEVTGKQDLALADVRDDIREELLQDRRDQAVGEWLRARQEQAEVVVNPRFGHWNPATGQIDPADDPLGDPPPAPPPAPGDDEPAEEPVEE